MPFWLTRVGPRDRVFMGLQIPDEMGHFWGDICRPIVTYLRTSVLRLPRTSVPAYHTLQTDAFAAATRDDMTAMPNYFWHFLLLINHQIYRLIIVWCFSTLVFYREAHNAKHCTGYSRLILHKWIRVSPKIGTLSSGTLLQTLNDFLPRYTSTLSSIVNLVRPLRLCHSE